MQALLFHWTKESEKKCLYRPAIIPQLYNSIYSAILWFHFNSEENCSCSPDAITVRVSWNLNALKFRGFSITDNIQSIQVMFSSKYSRIKIICNCNQIVYNCELTCIELTLMTYTRKQQMAPNTPQIYSLIAIQFESDSN